MTVHQFRFRGRAECLEARRLLTAFTFVDKVEVSFPDERPTFFVQSVDIDNDSDTDIAISLQSGKFAIVELDKDAEFTNLNVVDHGIEGEFLFAPADFDRDNDIDIVFGSESGEIFVANQQNGGEFAAPLSIGRFPRSDYTAEVHQTQLIDLDGDGDLDIQPGMDGKWFENDELVFKERDFPFRAWPNTFWDFDGDNDLDFLRLSFTDDVDDVPSVSWHENVGDTSFPTSHTIHESELAGWPHVVDIDNDSDLDVIVTTRNDIDQQRNFIVYTNTDGVFSRTQQLTVDHSFLLSMTVDADNDGEIDFLFSNPTVEAGRSVQNLSWLKNESGEFQHPEALATLHGPLITNAVSDLNSNGQLDFIVLEDQKLFVRELRVVGDSNADNRFDNLDLISVFQKGEYLDGIPGNSTFDEGDWNGDGDFDSGDLIYAFKFGHFANHLAADAAATAIARSIEDLDDRTNGKRAFRQQPFAPETFSNSDIQRNREF